MMQMWTNHLLSIVSPQIATSSPEPIVQEQVICNSFLETYRIKSFMKTERNEPLIFFNIPHFTAYCTTIHTDDLYHIPDWQHLEVYLRQSSEMNI